MSTAQNVTAYRVLGCIFGMVFSIPVLRFFNAKYVKPFMRSRAPKLGRTLGETQDRAPEAHQNIAAMNILSQYDGIHA